MELRYKCNTTNKCDKCGNLDAKLYEAIVITEELNVTEEWDETGEVEVVEYEIEEVEVVDHEICVCTKCGYEERI